MAYDLGGIAELVQTRLRENPLTRLRDLSAALGVDRHTINRALHIYKQTSFQELKASILREEVLRRLSVKPAISIKELAAEIGYQHSRSLSRRVRRLTGRSPTRCRHTGSTKGSGTTQRGSK